MLSLLGSEINLKGYVFRPLYLVFGLLCVSMLLIFLGLVYVILYTKNTLLNCFKELTADRDKWLNKK
jgi:hypothetical protein